MTSTDLSQSRFVRACRKQPVDRVPIWIMRQAGRYLPEYRELRKKHDFLEVCRTSELATEVTLQPLRRFAFDASILFSDILIPVDAMGCRVEFNPAPTFANPVRSAADISALHVPDPIEETGYVMDTVRMLKRELPEGTPLIGFSGAPITLATYMVEGGSSKTFDKLRRFMFEQPEAAEKLLDMLVETVISYLGAQAEAGADVLQLFDTWAGLFGPGDYSKWAVPRIRRITDSLRQYGVPLIYYANGAGALLPQMKELGVDGVGVDWRTSLGAARKTLGADYAVQGNLDPTSLYAPTEVINQRVKDVFDDAGDAPGHIFNLGHGILPDVPIDNVHALIEAVHEHGRRE
jgi:uroporphyrinogen decarboxylase